MNDVGAKTVGIVIRWRLSVQESGTIKVGILGVSINYDFRPNIAGLKHENNQID